MNGGAFWRGETLAAADRAFIVHPILDGRRDTLGDAKRSVEARLEEACGLARAIGLEIAGTAAVKIRAAKPATLFGSGQVEQIAAMLRADDASLVIVDAALSPVQQKSLEKAFSTKVIDRTGLILEIFGARAATAEGRLQVELAHLDYQAGRLVRSWTHLERQRGGFGFLGGPGETQIEADRRMIRDRMAKIRRELDQVSRTRTLHRSRRQRAPWPVIALVGYTNAGKSTLFNRMTGARVMAKDLLFATLDPTMREIRLPGVQKAILSDTVGFVSDLPTQLVAAFRATLEEVTSADLILHVRDIAHIDSMAQARDVDQVLAELGLNAEAGLHATPPILQIWNKIDLLPEDQKAAIGAEAGRRPDAVPVSAVTGEGIAEVIAACSRQLTSVWRVERLTIAAGDGASFAWLHAHGEVLDEIPSGEDGSVTVSVRLTPENYRRFVNGHEIQIK